MRQFGSRLKLTRRQFVLFTSALFTSAACGGVAIGATDVDIDRFMTLSRVLTAVDDLRDTSIGRTYLEAIRARPGGAERLAALWTAGGFDGSSPPASVADLAARGVYDDPALAELADTITANWYSGTYLDAEGRTQVATYTQALAWRPLAYRPAGPSSCGGAFGHWSDRPA